MNPTVGLIRRLLIINILAILIVGMVFQGTEECVPCY